MNRDEILATAATTINGDRDRDYGNASDNFRRMAIGWEVVLGVEVTPAQVALCMDWVKTTRLIKSPDHLDSWVDKAGYTALGAESATGK